MEKVYLKNKNEYCIGDKHFVEKIDSCTCEVKSDDICIYHCSIAGRDEPSYMCDKDMEKLCFGPENSNELWLSDAARKTVEDAKLAFDVKLEGMKPGLVKVEIPEWQMTVYYKCKGGLFDFIVEAKDEEGTDVFVCRQDSELEEIACAMSYFVPDKKDKKTIMPYPRHNIKKNPLYKSAIREGDKEFEVRLKLFYNADKKKDCIWLENLIGGRVLPRLSKFHDRMYAVNMTDEGLELLRRSGYKIIDREGLLDSDRNYSEYYINPHGKYAMNGVRLAKPKRPISFDEYLSMFEGK